MILYYISMYIQYVVSFFVSFHVYVIIQFVWFDFPMFPVEYIRNTTKLNPDLSYSYVFILTAMGIYPVAVVTNYTQ